MLVIVDRGELRASSISRRWWEWTSLTHWPPHVTPILGWDGHFQTPRSFPTSGDTQTLRHHCDQGCLVFTVFWVFWVFLCWESHYDVHCGRAWCRAAPVPSHAPPATITPLLSKWHNSQDVLPSLTGLSCSLVSTSWLGSLYKTSPALCRFEGIPAIIVVEQQNIFSLLNGCFCGYWCVFSGMIGSSWTGSWERAADGVPGVPPPLSNHCHKAALQIPIILFSLV